MSNENTSDYLSLERPYSVSTSKSINVQIGGKGAKSIIPETKPASRDGSTVETRIDCGRARC